MADIPTEMVALSDYLGEHVAAEQEALDAYVRLVDGRPGDIVSYLVGLILEDEKRHHEVFLTMRNTLESSIHWREIEPRLPSPHVNPAGIDGILAVTDQLLEIEREDAAELKALRRSWKRHKGERQLWTLLVKTAEMDTQKHIMILRYLQTMLREAQRRGQS